MTSAHFPIMEPGSSPQTAFEWLGRWWAVALVCFIAIVPLLIVDFPPLTDLYGHLGRYAVQTELAQRPALQPFFSYDWQLIGNLGGDIVVEVLHPVLGLEGSVRAAVILAQLLGAFALLLLSKEVHGRLTPFAVAAVPMLYGYPFNYGFLNYVLSMALAMLAYVVWLRLQRQERNIAARLWLGAAGAAIWVAHTYGWAFLGLLTGSTMLAQMFAGREKPVRAVVRIVGACWPLLLPIIPMVIWRAESSGAAMSGWALLYKWVFLLSPLRTKWEIFDIASAVLVLLVIVWALFSRTVRYDRGLAITALFCLAFFIVLPVKVFGSAFADMRLLPYGMAIGLVAIGPVQARSRVLAAASVLALAFFGVRMAATGAAYIYQARTIEAALPAVAQMPKGARVAFFVVKPCHVAWALPPLDHLSGAAMARRDAFVNDQWQQPGVNPLKVHYPAAEPFTRDPSHVVQGEHCGHQARRPLSQALAMLPRAAFTHVWIVGAIPADFPPPEGLAEVPGSGSGKLYRIVPQG
jgi:hypothetical protein